MGTVMALAQEHYVLRDRVRALESELAKTGSLDRASLDRNPTTANGPRPLPTVPILSMRF